MRFRKMCRTNCTSFNINPHSTYLYILLVFNIRLTELLNYCLQAGMFQVRCVNKFELGDYSLTQKVYNICWDQLHFFMYHNHYDILTQLYLLNSSQERACLIQVLIDIKGLLYTMLNALYFLSISIPYKQNLS